MSGKTQNFESPETPQKSNMQVTILGLDDIKVVLMQNFGWLFGVLVGLLVGWNFLELFAKNDEKKEN